ncbi:MAG: lactate racemase domain-containing protein [Spirochaetia bacterium]|nr:lactate racemase domain-containing protein [Spirochaetia bacterium]
MGPSDDNRKKARSDGMVASILRDVSLPKMCLLRQEFDPRKIDDIESAVREALRRQGTLERVQPGTEIAVTAGSRGIANIALILRTVVAELVRVGARPFLVPAMGSHGGCTGAGQKKVLEGYGITEEFTACPIRSSMETIQIAETPSGLPVYIDKHAFEAAGIVVVNRIKYHTAFRGIYESGLLKMITIGLGKQKGAELCHGLGLRSMSRSIQEISGAVIATGKILFGLGIVENAYDQTRTIRAIPAEALADEEPALLMEAKEHMPSIPFEEIDVLVVDEIGKDISGGGMDPNITGTFVDPLMEGGIRVQRTVVLKLTEETRGNATGLGRADFTTQKVFDDFDFEATYPNILTPKIIPPGKIPLVLATDALAIKAAIKTCEGLDTRPPRIVRIKNSLTLDRLFISEALVGEAKMHPEVKKVSLPEFCEFDEGGNLSSVWE